MPSVLAPVTYEPINAVRVMSAQATLPAMRRAPEAATQTFNKGVPVMIDGSGNIVEWTTGAANLVYGVGAEPPHNLAVAATAQDLSEGVPQNQPSGITTPIGAWPRDGKLGTYEANGQTVFSIALKAGQVFTQALITGGTALTLYRLIKDGTTKFWYLDSTLTGGNAGVAILLGLDSSCPNTVAGGSRVFFMFAAGARMFP